MAKKSALPTKKRKTSMSKTSMKKAKGGGHAGGMNVCLGDGSVRLAAGSLSASNVKPS